MLKNEIICLRKLIKEKEKFAKKTPFDKSKFKDKKTK